MRKLLATLRKTGNAVRGSIAEAPAKKSLRKGLWKQDVLNEVPTKRKLVFAEAPRKLAGGRVVISKEINKE